MKKGIKAKMVSARQFAKINSLSYTTVMSWLRQGLIPGAKKEPTEFGDVWRIPASAIDKVQRPKPGPKPQEKKK
jgi:predicted site-specific integrase-resolvase